MRLLCLLPLLALGCGPLCRPYSAAPNSVCLQADAGAVAVNQPFVVTTSNAGDAPGSPACTVTIDGGAITLTLSGTDCSSPQPFSTNPVVITTQARCLISALDAGQYTFNDGTTFNTAGPDDGGFKTCL